jgi:synaptobrevin family protein YKT6
LWTKVRLLLGRPSRWTRPLNPQLRTEYDFLIHAYARAEGICGIVITDKDYPPSVPQSLLSKICDEFVSKYPRSAYANLSAEQAKKAPLLLPSLDTYIAKYQSPSEVQNLLKIRKELDETQTVLNKTLESLLERGTKLEDMVAKSDTLSSQSKMFYTQAKKQNSCCIVM